MVVLGLAGVLVATVVVAGGLTLFGAALGGPVEARKVANVALIVASTFGAWSAAALMVAQLCRAHEAEGRALAAKNAEAGARLRMLRHQLNPHFLFNSLNSLSATIDEDRDRAQRLLLDLSSLLRDVLADDSDDGTLGGELDRVERYVRIERARFEERLHVQVSVPEELRVAPCLPLLLRPLVENGVKHGESRVVGGSAAHRGLGGRTHPNPDLEPRARRLHAGDWRGPRERPRAAGRPVWSGSPLRAEAAGRWMDGGRAELALGAALVRWRSLLVDDEPPARRRLRRLLEPHPKIEIAAEAGSLPSAVEALESRPIDLIFLDIHLSGETGFALWERMDVRARVVFVTAYDQHAVRAFERGALDYLLKPVDPQRLAITLERLPATPSAGEHASADDHVVCLGAGPRYRTARMHDITCVRAQGDYTLIHLRDGSEELVACSLQSWAARLPVGAFARVHRSTIVRLELVDRLEPRGSAWVAKVRHLDGVVHVSRRYLRRLRERFRMR